MLSLKQQANSHQGSGVVQATAYYVGSTAEGHVWRMVAKVAGKKVYSEDSYKTGFVGADVAAQKFADYVYDELYSEGALEPTDRELEIALAVREELALERANWTEEEKAEQARFDEEVELFGFAA